jgi:hypothetical protein
MMLVIFDNLFSIRSILEYMDVNELDGLLISFDQEKAFDRAEHLFITEVLKAMNLPVNFIRSWRGVLDTTLCDKVCQKLGTGRWVCPGTPISSTNKTDHHDITEILLKVELSS